MTAPRLRWLLVPALAGVAVLGLSNVSTANHNADPAAHPLPVINLEQGSKAMVVRLRMTGPGAATMIDSDVVFGRARGSAGEPPLLALSVWDDKSGLAQQLNAWDPRWYEAEGTTPGSQSMRIASTAVGAFVFPFESDLRTLSVFNTHEGVPVGSYDLEPAIRAFCEANPSDVDCRTDLAVVKADGADPAVAGTDLTYTITVANQGPNPAHSARVVDTLPAGLAFVSGSPGCTATPANVVTCALTALPAGQSRAVTVTARIASDLVYNAGAPVTISNTATVANPAGDDLDPSDNSDTETTRVVAVADVSIDSVGTQAPLEVLIGEPASARIDVTVSNAGPSSPIDATLAGAATASPGVGVTPPSTSTAVTALAIGTPQTVPGTVTLTCTSPGRKTISLSYGLTLTRPDDTDPDPSDNSATTSFEIDCVVPIAINIRPKGFPNSINLNTDATLAALTTQAGEYSLPLPFDASGILIDTVRFGLRDRVFNVAVVQGAAEMHSRTHLERSYELDERTRDADLDAVMHFKPPGSGLAAGSTQGCLKGRFRSGSDTFTFLGCDSVRVVP